MAATLPQRTPAEHKAEFAKRFANMTDEELTMALVEDSRKPGWTSARGAFMSALKDEMNKRLPT